MTDMTNALSDPNRLASLHRTQLMDSPPEEAFDRFTRLASRILDAPVALVSLLDDKRQFFKSLFGLADPWSAAREAPPSYCRHVVQSGGPLVISDARRDPRFSSEAAITEMNAVSYCGVPVVDPSGHVLGTVCVLDEEPRTWTPEDVTALQDIAQSVISEVHLRLVAEDLKDANAALQEFIAMASHDIRNPLAVILMQTHLLADPEGVSGGELEQSTRSIRSEAKRANRMVGELLELSKLEAGGVEPMAVDGDLESVLGAVVDAHPAEDGVKLTVPAGLRVRADIDHVRRIVANLTGNAVKYGSSPIFVEAEQQGETVEIVVADAGPGVPLDFVPRLFQRFARSDEARASGIEGTGLGLSIVAKLVELNGGSIRYEANPIGGARFVVRLPSPMETDPND